MNTEIKSIEGFPNYTISNTGVVTNIVTNYVKRSHVGANGYPALSLVNNGYAKTLTIHRLLALHFLPNPENKRTVNHIDGVKTNNSLSNLEWATDQENCLHAYATGLSAQAKFHTEGTLLEAFEQFKSGKSFEKISAEMGCVTSATTTNLRKLLKKLGLEADLDKHIKINKDKAMKQAGLDKRNIIPLKMIDKKTLKVVDMYTSITEAQESLNLKSSGPIANALSGFAKSAAGYHWLEDASDRVDFTGTPEAIKWRARNTRGTNKYVGVRFRKDTGKYKSCLGKKSLGCYSTEEEALEVRNKYALSTNMPEEVQELI